MKISVVLLFLICLSQDSFPQQGNLVFHKLNKEKGVSISVCNDLVKDKRGVIWMTSASGLFRYDGISFTEVTQHSPRLKGRLLSDIYDDAKGNLWIAKNDAEIVRYDLRADTFELIDLSLAFRKEQIPVSLLTFHFIDASDNLWIHFNGFNIACYNTRQKTLKIIYNKKDIFWDRFIYPIPGNNTGTWIFENQRSDTSLHWGKMGSDGKISWMGSRKSHFFIFPFAVFSGKGQFYTVIAGGLHIYDFTLNTHEFYRTADSNFALKPNYKMLLDPKGRLWIPTNSGLHCFDTKEKKFTNFYSHNPYDAYSIMPDIEPLFYDDDNVLWLRSWGKGINYADLNSFKFKHVLTEKESDRSGYDNFIRALCMDDQGRYYASLQYSGVVQMDKQGKIIKQILGPQPVPFVYLLKDRRGNIWIANNSLFCYDPKTGQSTKVERSKEIYEILTMAELKNGNILIGAYDEVQLFDPVKKQLLNIKGFEHKPTVHLFVELGNGDLLICQREEGVSLYTPDTGGYRFVQKLNSNLFVKSFLSISNEMVYLATTTGLHQYHAGQRKLIPLDSINRQLSNNYLYGILYDQKGYIWVSSNNGLSRWKPGIDKVRNFGLEYGLQDLEFNSNAFAGGREHDLWFGGVNGINIIDKHVPTRFTDIAPNLQLVSLHTDSTRKLYPVDENNYPAVAIKPGTQSVEIEYNAIHYFNPEKVHVQYRLIPYDETWVTDRYAGRARFFKVPPGKYRFEIRASDTNGNWPSEVITMPVECIPYWWQTSWFRIAALFVMIMAVLAGIRLYTLARLRKQRFEIERSYAIQNERERIIADLHDDIGATISSMSIYGHLANDIWDSKPDESRKLIEKITRSSKELINRMSDIIWSMKVPEEGKYKMENRLRFFCNELLSPAGIAYETKIDESVDRKIIDPEIRKNILLIAKEAINNAMKHSGASKVDIQLLHKEDSIILNISDNGNGLKNDGDNNGNGMRNIRKRCTLLDGDCHYAKNETGGTSLHCSFPASTICRNP